MLDSGQSSGEVPVSPPGFENALPLKATEERPHLDLGRRAPPGLRQLFDRPHVYRADVRQRLAAHLAVADHHDLGAVAGRRELLRRLARLRGGYGGDAAA